MQRTTRLLAAAVAAVVLTAGCGGDEGADAGDTSSGASNDAGTSGVDNGEPGTGGASSEVADISVPLAPGADAVSTSESGEFTTVLYNVPLESQESTIAFYDDWTAGQPDEYQRIEAAGGGVSWQNAPGPGGEKHLIAVLAPLEGDDFVSVSLGVGPPE